MQESSAFGPRLIIATEGREIDFVVLRENHLEELIEVKFSDENVSRSLLYYTDRLNPPKATQIVAHLKKPFDPGRIMVTDPFSYFQPNIFES